MLVTISTIRQLPQAFALADSFIKYAAGSPSVSVVIGLADDPAHLPSGFSSPYPLLPISDILAPEQLTALSLTYTSTEFAAACKPLLLKELFRQYPGEENFLYADPNIQFLAPLTPLWDQLASATLLITPFITRNPQDTYWPDEKFFQNVGLYTSDFLALRRSDETERFLNWWDDRVRERAYIDFCAGLCLDQIWLMHVPVFFPNAIINRNPGWHVALWNLPERTVRQGNGHWLIDGPTAADQPLLFMNFKGLLNPDDGLFPHQTRFHLSKNSAVTSLVATYRQALSVYSRLPFSTIRPAYGQKPEPVVLRGWRYATVKSMRTITRFLDKLYLPAVR